VGAEDFLIGKSGPAGSRDNKTRKRQCLRIFGVLWSTRRRRLLGAVGRNRSKEAPQAIRRLLGARFPQWGSLTRAQTKRARAQRDKFSHPCGWRTRTCKSKKGNRPGELTGGRPVTTDRTDVSAGVPRNGSALDYIGAPNFSLVEDRRGGMGDGCSP